VYFYFILTITANKKCLAFVRAFQKSASLFRKVFKMRIAFLWVIQKIPSRLCRSRKSASPLYERFNNAQQGFTKAF